MSTSVYALSSNSAENNIMILRQFVLEFSILTVSSRIIGLDQEMFPWPQTCEGEQCGENGDHSKGQHFAVSMSPA